MPVDYVGVGDPIIASLSAASLVENSQWPDKAIFICACRSILWSKLTCWHIPLVLQPGPLIPTPLLPSGFMRYPSFYDKQILLPHRWRSLLHTTSPGLHLTRRRSGQARWRLA